MKEHSINIPGEGHRRVGVELVVGKDGKEKWNFVVFGGPKSPNPDGTLEYHGHINLWDDIEVNRKIIRGLDNKIKSALNKAYIANSKGDVTLEFIERIKNEK